MLPCCTFIFSAENHVISCSRRFLVFFTTQLKGDYPWTEHDLRHADIFPCSQIDQAGVAAALGMKNVRSVGNKVGAMKKKYNLPLGTSTKGSAAESPSIPKTTKGDKVNKTPTKKKAATSKAHLLAKKEEPENEDEVEQEDEEEDAASGAEEEDLEEA
jgi:hypothetical protein